VARQKLGGTNFTYNYFRQLAVLDDEALRIAADWDATVSRSEWMSSRVCELIYTSWDMEPLAFDLGFTTPPFRWEPARRAFLRAELDAAFFHAYGLAEEDVDYIMETFPIVKRRDEEQHGHYRTKALILDVYRKMADAIATGVPYETILDPPPADARVAHQAPGLQAGDRTSVG
jgi:hypothetical protein